jgi:hypothetical protein
LAEWLPFQTILYKENEKDLMMLSPWLISSRNLALLEEILPSRIELQTDVKEVDLL